MFHASAGLMARGLGGKKLNPIAQAPRSTDRRASCQVVIPQILTRVGMESGAEKIPQRGPRVGLRHQMLADQKCIESRRAKAHKMLMRAQSGFAYGNALVRDFRD